RCGRRRRGARCPSGRSKARQKGSSQKGQGQAKSEEKSRQEETGEESQEKASKEDWEKEAAVGIFPTLCSGSGPDCRILPGPFLFWYELRSIKALDPFSRVP